MGIRLKNYAKSSEKKSFLSGDNERTREYLDEFGGMLEYLDSQGLLPANVEEFVEQLGGFPKIR